MTETQVEYQAPFPNSGEIVAPPGRYYRNARYLIFLLFFFWGVWSLYDGFVKYPAEKAYDEAHPQVGTIRHAGWDIPFNRMFGIALPPLSIAVVAWALYRSRGQYRLAGNILYVPGHPPIPLNSIKTVDKTLWERKGIAMIEYELPTGRQGKFKLDDFVYQQQPTDEIVKRIEAHLHELAGEPAPPEPAE